MSLVDGTPVSGEFDWRSLARGATARIAKRFAWMADGTPATYPVVAVAGRTPGPIAALIAGIHGDEYEGPTALWDVLNWLDPATLRGTVVVVPVAHTAAFAAGTRESPVDGMNLARSFPGDPGGSLTQRLAADLFATVVAGADLLVDLHSGGARLAFVQVAGFYGEGPLAARSLALAVGMGLPFVWRLPARPGVLSFEAMRVGVAAAGCEAGGRGGCLPADTAAYARGVLGVLADQGMIDRPPDVPQPRHPTHCLDGDFALAPMSGFLDPAVALGGAVSSGDLLATIRSVGGHELARLLAETDGVVMAERHLRTIHAGEWATCAVRSVPL